MRKVILVLLTFLSFQLSAYQYKLSICSVFQNEARFMKEWIDYHRLVGVEHFWLYNNESTDNFEEVLQPYIDQGIVELFFWPDLTPEIWFPYGCQERGFNDAVRRAKHKSKWLAALDLDEFMVPKEGYSIVKLLDIHFRHEVGVCIYWQMFGTSYIEYIHPNELMIERLTMRQKEPHPWYKSIVRPKYVEKFEGPHYAYYKLGKLAVNTKHFPCYQYSNEATLSLDLIQLNHYWPRDIHNLKTVKWPRQQKWGNNWDGFLNSCNGLNQVQDTEILKFIPLMKNNF